MTNSLHVTIVAKVISSILIFLLQKCESFCNTKDTHIFSSKNINVFAIFQDFKIEILKSR